MYFFLKHCAHYRYKTPRFTGVSFSNQKMVITYFVLSALIGLLSLVGGYEVVPSIEDGNCIYIYNIYF